MHGDYIFSLGAGDTEVETLLPLSSRCY